MMRLLGVSGSLRSGSDNVRLLANAARLLPPTVEFLEFGGIKAIPAYDQDDEDSPGSCVIRWRDALEEVDAVLFATPEYNSSIPGALKNAIDWASRPAGAGVLENKPVAAIGASRGAFGAVWAQAELRKVLAAAGARVVQREMAVGNSGEAFDSNGVLVDRTQRLLLSEILIDLLAEVDARLPQAARVGGSE